MLSDYIKQSLLGHFPYEPTPSQVVLVEQLSGFLSQPDSRQVFILRGYAGTGKTTMMSALVRTLEQFQYPVVLMAPTGRAAKVLSAYTNRMASTIHKGIYKVSKTKDMFAQFVRAKNLYENAFFIVDEASMISNEEQINSVFGSGNLLSDLLQFVENGKNCRLIFVGDTAQLPPVGLSLSPALEPKLLKNHGRDSIMVELTDVVRQAKDSGILFNATQLRHWVIDKESFGKYPKFKLESFPDIERISGSDLIEKIQDSYSKYGMEQTMVVSRSNKRANRYNSGIRNSILWREEEISVDDYLMVVKNNYFWLPKGGEIDFIANGDIVQLVKIRKYYERYGFRFVDVCLRLVDYGDLEVDARLLLDVVNLETASLPEDKSRELFAQVMEDYDQETTAKKKYKKVKEDPFYNALQVKFAYAITCHKAQGGQWKSIFVDLGYVTEEMVDADFLRWLYTAVTRSTEKLYLVNFDEKFFE